MSDEIKLSKAQLTDWTDWLISMNHHGTLVHREIDSGNYERAAHLAELARRRARKMPNEMQKGLQQHCNPLNFVGCGGRI